MTSIYMLCLVAIVFAQQVLSFDKPELYEVGSLQYKIDTNEVNTTWPVITLPKLDLSLGKINSTSKSPRCLCKLPLPIPIPVPINTGAQFGGGVGVNNNVAATQLLSDGRTALYNNMGQIIGYLPAGSNVVNNFNG